MLTISVALFIGLWAPSLSCIEIQIMIMNVSFTKETFSSFFLVEKVTVMFIFC